MIIILHGKDSYRLREKLEEIIKEYRKKNKGGFDLKFLSDANSLEDIYNEERQVSIFEEKKFLVIRGCFSSSLKQSIIENHERIISTENIIVFYEEGEIRKNDALLALLLKNKDVKQQEFTPLSGKNLFNWIKGEFEKEGVEVEKEAIESLMLFGGEDLWRIKNEIKKLSLYGNVIKKSDITLLVKMEVETNIFKMIDALAFGEKEKAISHLYNHLQKGDNPLYLFSMINYQFRNLSIVRDLLEENLDYNTIKKKSGLHPFVFSKTYKQSKRFSYQELKKIYSQLFEMDLKIKTGQIDPVLALHLFLFNS